MNNLPKKTSITLSVIHLPLIIALLVIAGLGASTISINKVTQQKPTSTSVLSDEDEREGQEDSEDREDEEDRDEDSDDRNEEDDDKSDNDSDDSREEKTKVETKRTNTTTTRAVVQTESKEEIEDRENETEDLEDDDSADDEVDESEDHAEVSTVTNPDGTVTKTFKKTDGDEVETIILTYDANGVLLKKVKLDEKGNAKEERLELRENELAEEGSDDANEREDDSDDFKLTFRPSATGDVDPALSGIIKAKLKTEIENNEELGATVHKVALEIKTTDGRVKYEGQAIKLEKLFGLFGIEVPVDLEIDPITGKITSVKQTFWSKILDTLSL